MTAMNNEAVLAQFNQLIEDVLAGTLRRSVFCPWEIAILVDMVRCNLRQSSKRDSLLRQYRNAMERYLRDGAEVPLKLSDYLESLHGNARDVAGHPALSAHGG
jgi:hypothetical protein